MVYFVYSLESPQLGDSNEYTKYTFVLKKSKRYPYFAFFSNLLFLGPVYSNGISSGIIINMILIFHF